VASVVERKPGDLILFKWPGVSSAPCDHVGMLDHDRVHTIEGNTSRATPARRTTAAASTAATVGRGRSSSSAAPARATSSLAARASQYSIESVPAMSA
jgi:hypothetical protein